MSMLSQVAHTFTVSPNVPAKTEFWQGYDQYLDCHFSGDWLSAEELASMTDGERRGYETAGRHQSDCETGDYLVRYNTNSYGDFTQAASF